MKKLWMICLVLCLMLPCAATAEEAGVGTTTANAVAECVNTYDVTAPFAGVVLPFTWERGDRVQAQDALFTLDTVKVYAPESGTLRGLFVKEGELCEDAISQYGMIAAIEKTQPLVLNANTKGAYDSEENKIIHLGATVYFEQVSDADNEGEGRVIAVRGESFTVELTAGSFEPGNKVRIYTEEKMGTKTKIGEGTMERGADVAVMGSGRVLKVYDRQGQQVSKGQLLFELIPADADPTVNTAKILAGASGVLDAPKVISGQQVYKGQTLATVHDDSAMQVVAEVDEVDLDKVHIGDSLSIVFDRYPEMKVSGTVHSIAAMGREKQNATYYDVEIVFTTSAEVLTGMNATVYLPN